LGTEPLPEPATSQGCITVLAQKNNTLPENRPTRSRCPANGARPSAATASTAVVSTQIEAGNAQFVRESQRRALARMSAMVEARVKAACSSKYSRYFSTAAIAEGQLATLQFILEPIGAKPGWTMELNH